MIGEQAYEITWLDGVGGIVKPEFPRIPGIVVAKNVDEAAARVSELGLIFSFVLTRIGQVYPGATA